MRLPIPAVLFALLVISGCQSGDRADNASAETSESALTETAVPNDTAVGEATCEPEREQGIPSPGACARIVLGSATVEVQYGSPSKKDREVFGGLVPYGEVWRTGANEATVFKTDSPLTIGGEVLPAGSYGLFTIPGETEWTVIFNSVPDQWGAFEYDAGQDVLRTVVDAGTSDPSQEQFLISFEPVSDTDAMMVLTWDEVGLVVPLTVSG
jgi:hypothetical protein